MPQEKNMPAPPENAAADTPKNAQENTPEKASKKKRVSRRRVVLIVLLILAVTVPTAIFSLASGDRREGFARPEITPEDWERQSRLTLATMQRVLDKNNTEEFARVTLSPADVNTLLRFAINSDRFAGMFGRRSEFTETAQWTGEYDGRGRFHLGYILRGPGTIRFTLRGSVSGRYGNNRFELEPENCRIGSLPVPAWAVRSVLPHVFDRLNRKKHVQFFHMAVETIEQDKDHNIIVTYRPAQARAMPRKGFRR